MKRISWFLCCFVLAFADAVLAQQHFLPRNDSVLRACEFRFGQPPPILPAMDVVLPAGVYDQKFTIPLSRPPISGQPITCNNFGWAQLPAIPHGEVIIEPVWAGRELNRTRSGSAQMWDCNHSKIEYAIYAATSIFLPVGFRFFGGVEFQELLLEQRLIGGGELWGWLMPLTARRDGGDHGECIYRTTDPAKRNNAPSGWGRDSQETTTIEGLRIAVLSQSHNDRSIGHSGTDCADPVDCWWPTELRIATRPIESLSTPCGAVFADQVVIYQHSRFRGKCKILGIGEYPHSDAFDPVSNDSVSSIQVGADVTVTLYQHAKFQGLSLTVDGGQDRESLHSFSDRTSSMKVQLR